MFALILFIIFILVFGTYIYAGFKGAPWVPSWKKDLERFLDLAQIKPGELVYDLGAGDGRLVITAVKEYGAKAVGFEFSLIFYIWSKLRVLLSAQYPKARIEFGDFYRKDFSQADVIVCFLTPMAMKLLKPKFEKELKKGVRVVSYAFKIKGWRTKKVSKPKKDDVPIFSYIVDPSTFV